ncbi:MAG: hypothetical protein ACK48I_12400 [Bacteroidota bacterium]|jgi:hypothetical protein
MNQHYTQTKDALYNPKNPVNPDSKPGAYLYKIESIYLSIYLLEFLVEPKE